MVSGITKDPKTTPAAITVSATENHRRCRFGWSAPSAGKSSAGWKSTPVMAFFKGVNGSSLRVPFRSGLARERVRYVGEPIALLIAANDYQAQDAAERIEMREFG